MSNNAISTLAVYPSPVIDAQHLASIQKTCRDAQFGYCSVGYIEYYKDVSLLLSEREQLISLVDNLRADVLRATAKLTSLQLVDDPINPELAK